MWAALATAVGLIFGAGTAHAADSAGVWDPTSGVDEAEWYAPLAQDTPIDKIGDKVDEMKSEADRKREERLKKLEELNKGKTARVIILQQEGTDETNEVLQRNVKSRISRPDAKFYPDVDLYQQGRKEPDRSLRPIEQRAEVPDDVFTVIEKAVAETEILDWDDLDETGWGLRAAELRKLTNELWFMDREDVRLPLFRLYAQIGRSANNMNNTSPPFFEQIGDQPVNYYFFLAAAMAFQEDSLLSEISHQETKDNIKYYYDQLKEGAFPMMKLSFELSGSWDASKFASEYEAYVNGKETLIESPTGLWEVPPGRVDIYLKRSDGHSMSHRLDLDKFDNNIFFLRDEARKKMGLGFAEQLMDHPNECIPDLDGEILTYLNIYAKLHPDAEIYIGVPVAGNPNKVYLWRFDHASGTLFKVNDETGGFPVRFAMMFGTGLTFGGASVQIPEPTIDPTTGATLDPTPPNISDFVTPVPNGMPFNYQLRGHYVRLMFLFGINFGLSFDGTFQDAYQTDDNDAVDASGAIAKKERKLNRELYGGFGLVLGKEAANGIGPRGYLQGGVLNVPHTVDVSLHLGHTAEAPFSSSTGRVRPILDVDTYGGILWPLNNTFLDKKKPLPNLGVTASAGLTF